MKKIKLGISLLLVCVFSGCATVSQSNLYWGNYSNSLYKLKKNPGAESIESHRVTLLKIIEDSKTRNLRVPPGVLAELGYIHLEMKDFEVAKEYFIAEAQLYPESEVLMATLVERSEEEIKKGSTEEQAK